MKAFLPLKYLKEVRSELRQVTWPTKKAVTKLTTVVIVVSVAASAYLGLLDLIFTKLIELILKK